MKKICCVFAFILIFCTVCLAAEENPILRVGLYYEEDAMPTANLQVTNGVGYRFGFFDSNLNFVQLYSTNTEKITMTNDANLWHSNNTFYTNNAPAGSKVLGAYHVEVGGQFNDLTSAEQVLTSFKNQGYYGFVAYIEGTYRVRIGSYTSISEAETIRVQIGGEVVGASKTGVTVYDTTTGTALFEYDGSTYSSLAVNPTQGEVSMPLTWFKGMKWNGAFEYVRNGGNITVINVVPMQDYLKGVIPWEMYPSDPLEALKAQALCARTYAYYHMGKHGVDFDICAGVHCQAYKGMTRANENTNRAVDETIGQYILYNGSPINAVFHSCDGGATEDAKNVWGSDIPYLKGKVDPYEKSEKASNGVWSYTYTPQELTDILNAKGYNAALITDVYAEHTELGNVLRLVLVDVNGKEWEFKRERARTIINSSSLGKYTYSQRYTISRDGESSSLNVSVNGGHSAGVSGGELWAIGANGKKKINAASVIVATDNGNTVIEATHSSGGTGNFTISGRGWGHNVGLSQEGAADMAELGMDAYDIIHFYYTDVTITNEF